MALEDALVYVVSIIVTSRRHAAEFTNNFSVSLKWLVISWFVKQMRNCRI